MDSVSTFGFVPIGERQIIVDGNPAFGYLLEKKGSNGIRYIAEGIEETPVEVKPHPTIRGAYFAGELVPEKQQPVF